MNRRRLFLDSSFWISLRDEKEPEHKRAGDIVRSLLDQKEHLVITPLIVAETHAYFARAPHRARQILDDFESNPVMICELLSPGDQQAAIRLLREQRDKSYSFCDAVSFAVMRRLGIKRVATFDEHFRQFGEFEVIS